MTNEEERAKIREYIGWVETLKKDDFNLVEEKNERVGAWIKKSDEDVLIAFVAKPHTKETISKNVYATLLCAPYDPQRRELIQLAVTMYYLFDKPLLLNLEEAAE